MSRTPITINVDVQYALDGKGNCSGGRYQATCDKDGITVHDKNVAINYVLSDATPQGIVFSGFTASPTGQLTPPSISQNGRTMSTIDLDTRAGVIKVNLEFRDSSVFVLDPEVTNEPTPGYV